MGWISPTGNNDPDEAWTLEVRAYNDDTGNYASTSIAASSWSSYLELTFSSTAISQVRLYSEQPQSQVDIDYYYTSAWHNVYEGAIASSQWVTKSCTAATSVTKVRFRFYNATGGAVSARLNDVDVWQIDDPTVTTQAASSITINSATGNANITAIGDGTDTINCTKRGIEYGTETGVYNNTVIETGTFSTGAYTASITGLSAGTTYYYRGKAYHVYGSAGSGDGWGYGSEQSFTTTTRSITLKQRTDHKGRILSDARAELYRTDTGALLDTDYTDSSGDVTLSGIVEGVHHIVKLYYGNRIQTYDVLSSDLLYAGSGAVLIDDGGIKATGETFALYDSTGVQKFTVYGKTDDTALYYRDYEGEEHELSVE
jgi:hypothetical protein